MSNTAGEKWIVFVKAPRLGFVKTRIAATVGDRAALLIYQTLVHKVLETLSTNACVELRYTPDDAAPEIVGWLEKSWTHRPQGDGDLGERMHRACEESFTMGAKRVLIIGSDCPYLTANDLTSAAQALVENDLVLGPATDGGYWLIGLRRPQKELFLDMKWSTATVFRETVDRAERLGLKLAILRPLSDIDTEEDWLRFKADPSFPKARRWQ